MLTVGELKRLAQRLDDAALEKQLGPFVLVERPFVTEASAHTPTGVRATRPMKDARKHSLLAFDDLWVAALPPVREQDALLVGRAPDCDLVLDESTVSKHHARIHWTGAHAELEDLGSSNGTRLNAQVVMAGDRRQLKDNDAIDFGAVKVYFFVASSVRSRVGLII